VHATTTVVTEAFVTVPALPETLQTCPTGCVETATEYVPFVVTELENVKTPFAATVI
jgi:hypothetical protein